MFVTFFDTTMVSLVAIVVWRISPFFVFLPWLTIASMDGAYLSSALTKVPTGAWFTITLAGVLASFLLLWRFGKEQQWQAEAADRFPTSHFIRVNKDGDMHLADRFDGTPVSTTKGLGVFYDKAGETTPIVFSQFILKLTSVPEVIIFFHLRPLETPSVGPADRHTVSRLAIPNCYRRVVRYGDNDVVITPDLAAVLISQVRKFLVAEQLHKDVKGPDRAKHIIISDAGDNGEIASPGEVDMLAEKLVQEQDYDSELVTLERAWQHKILYIIGKEQMKITKSTNFLRKTLLWAFLWVRENTRNKMANLRVPTDKVIEVGFLKEIS